MVFTFKYWIGAVQMIFICKVQGMVRYHYYSDCKICRTSRTGLSIFVTDAFCQMFGREPKISNKGPMFFVIAADVQVVALYMKHGNAWVFARHPTSCPPTFLPVRPNTNWITRRALTDRHTNGSGGRKSKSGFANTVFNTDFCQIVFWFGLYFDLDFIYGLYMYLDLDLDLLLVDLCPPL